MKCPVVRLAVLLGILFASFSQVLYCHHRKLDQMKLPNGEQVKKEQINEKLVAYILEENHKDGKHKARLFRSKLGITLENKEILIDALIQVAQKQDFCANENSKYGQKYVIDFELITAQGSSKIRSAWIVRNNENYPRLTTVYPID